MISMCHTWFQCATHDKSNKTGGSNIDNLSLRQHLLWQPKKFLWSSLCRCMSEMAEQRPETKENKLLTWEPRGSIIIVVIVVAVAVVVAIAILILIIIIIIIITSSSSNIRLQKNHKTSQPHQVYKRYQARNYNKYNIINIINIMIPVLASLNIEQRIADCWQHPSHQMTQM